MLIIYENKLANIHVSGVAVIIYIKKKRVI